MHLLTELFNQSPVVYVELEDEPENLRHWFRATEVCATLQFTETTRTVKTYCKEYQYREFQVGKGRPAIYLSEAGVYRLLLRSKSPVAVEFQDWLTEDLLPKLRSQSLVTLRQSNETLAQHNQREKTLLAVNKQLLNEKVALESELNSTIKRAIQNLEGMTVREMYAYFEGQGFGVVRKDEVKKELLRTCKPINSCGYFLNSTYAFKDYCQVVYNQFKKRDDAGMTAKQFNDQFRSLTLRDK